MSLRIPRPNLRPIVNTAKKVLPVLCPNPNVSISALPPKITFGCR